MSNTITFGLDSSCTGRGYFTDGYGQKCIIQPSSAAEEPHIHFGVKDGGEHFPATRNATMHLSQSMVVELLPYLQAFAATGDLNATLDAHVESEKQLARLALQRALEGAAGQLEDEGYEELADTLRRLGNPEPDLGVSTEV